MKSGKWRRNAGARIRKQRPLILIAAIVVALLLVIGGTFAWYTGADSVTNNFKTGQINYSTRIQETFTPPGSITPGQSYEKIVTVQNTGDLPGFVRVLLMTEIMAPDGTLLASAPGPDTFSYTFPNSDWADGGDGYYYYLGIVQPGQTTSPLITGVTLSSALADQYANAQFDVQVKSESSDIAKWDYRQGWWNTQDPSALSDELKAVDNVLSGLAK